MKPDTMIWLLGIGMSIISFLLLTMIGLIVYIWKERKQILNNQLMALDEGNQQLAAEVGVVKEENATLKSETRNLTKAIEDLRGWLARVNREHSQLLQDVAALKVRAQENNQSNGMQ